jgi:AcrR family transcriptional regulator
MPRLQPYHHGDLKTALLDSAEAILREEGLAGLTLRAAARRAGVSHAAPTHHFGDLTGLLSELAARGFLRFAADLRAASETSPAAPGAAAARAYVAFAQDNPAMLLLMFSSDRIDQQRPALRAAMEVSFGALIGFAEEPKPGSPEMRAAVARAARNWSLVHGFAMLLIDKRLKPLLDRVPGSTPESLLADVIGLMQSEGAASRR